MQKPDNDNEWHGVKPIERTRRQKIVGLLLSVGAIILSALLVGIPLITILRGMGLWFW